MTLLAIETATHEGSVAMIRGDEITSAVLGRRQQASRLASTVSDLIQNFGQPSVCAIDIGPGSFTGLRVGLAFLKGLARVYEVPVIPLGSLDVLAAEMLQGTAPDTVALPILKASGAFVFAGLFTMDGNLPANHPSMPVGLYEAANLASRVATMPRVLVGGEGLSVVDGLETHRRSEFLVPSAVVLGQLALIRHAQEKAIAAREVELAYHQPSAAEAKRGFITK